MNFHIWSSSHIIKKTEFQKGLKSLKNFGFSYEISKKVESYSVKNQSPLLPFLAGNDEIKVQEFLKICNNPKAQWILATRGGYGCLRLLALLDKEQIQRSEALHIWGYSDLTVLQLYFWQRKGWSYVQGPLVGSDSFTKATPNEKKVFENIAKFGVFPSKFTLKALNKKESLPTTPHLLLGGNLASVVTLLGTPWEPRPDKDFFLFLEDIDEAGYKVDRLLTQLKNSRFFDRCRGILLGHFTKSPDYVGVFKALSLERKVPVYSGISMGHESPRIPLVLGRDVIFDGTSLRYG